MDLDAANLVASQSGRKVDTAFLAGRRAILVVHGAGNSEAAKDVSKAVRARFPSARDVLVVSVVDLRAMAGMWRRVAEAQVKSTYEKLAQKVRDNLPGETAEDHVLICPDWDGTGVTALGAAQAAASAVALVVGVDGSVRRLEGADLAGQVATALT